MLFSLYPEITQNYFVLSLVVTLGTLQWSAARHKQLKLSWLGPWALNKRGSVIGIILIAGGVVWFFAFTPGLFTPGLAGGELSSLFGLGCLCGLLVIRLCAAAWQKSPSISDKV